MFLSCYIPDFPAEAVLRRRAELRHAAVAIVEGTPPLSYVVAVNAHARELGVGVGMTKLQAETFIAAAGAVIARDALAESAAHAALLDAAAAISPKLEDTAADVVIVDASGLERLFGTPRQVARELARRVADQSLEANIALASTPDTAEHAARGFAGVTVLDAATELDRIGALPLEVLFAAEVAAVARGGRDGAAHLSNDDRRKALDRLARMHETLERWGVRTFRALAALPAASLSERLGRHGVRLQQLANAAIRRELVPAEAPLVFEEAMELDSPVETIEPLLFLLSHLVEQVCARLSVRALCAHELRLSLTLERHAGDEVALTRDELAALGDGATTERRITLPVAMNDAKLFLKLLHLQLAARPPGAPVIKIAMVAEPARPRVAQAGLFMPLSPEPEKLELTLARLHKLLSTVPANDNSNLRAGCAELLDTHEPGAFRMTRFIANDAETSDVARETSDKPTLALRRFRPPVAATVRMKDGHPSMITSECIGGGTAKVLWAAGPWKTSGRWWMQAEQQTWECEEWDVAVEEVSKVSRSEVSNVSNVSKVEVSEVAEVSEVGRTADRLMNAKRANAIGGAPFVVTNGRLQLCADTTDPKHDGLAVLYRVARDSSSDSWTVHGLYD